MADEIKLRDIVKAEQDGFSKLAKGTLKETYNESNLYEVELGAPIILGSPSSGMVINGDNELVLAPVDTVFDSYVCRTAGDVVNKEIVFTDFSLINKGLTPTYYAITMIYDNTAIKPQLNINNTGNKPIYIDGEKPDTEVKAKKLKAGHYLVRYDKVLGTRHVDPEHAGQYIWDWAFFFRSDGYVEELTENFVGEGAFSLNRKPYNEESDVKKKLTEIGKESIVMGKDGVAVAENSIALGNATIAGAKFAKADGDKSVAFGEFARADGEESVSSGKHSTASGYKVMAGSEYAKAEGSSTAAGGKSSHVEGLGEISELTGTFTATGTTIKFSSNPDERIHVGSVLVAKEPREWYSDTNKVYKVFCVTAITVGTETTVTIDSELKEGFEGLSIVLGAAGGEGAHAEGQKVQAVGKAAHAEGSETIAFGEASHASGFKATAIGKYSEASGNETLAVGDYSAAYGEKALAGGVSSTAIGKEVIAGGNYSIAEGESTEITSLSSLSGFTIDDKKLTFSTWNEKIVKGSVLLHKEKFTGCIKELYKTFVVKAIDKDAKTATLDLSPTANTNNWVLAEGYAGGVASHSFGKNTQAAGDYSIAAGEATKAIGDNSFAAGQKARAIGKNSFAQGTSTGEAEMTEWTDLNITAIEKVTGEDNTIKLTTDTTITTFKNVKIRHKFEGNYYKYTTGNDSSATVLVIRNYFGPDIVSEEALAKAGWSLFNRTVTNHPMKGGAISEGSIVGGLFTQAGSTAEEDAKIISDLPGFQTSHDYEVGDQIKQNNKAYSCITKHKSGDAFDSSKWTELKFESKYALAQGEGTVASRKDQVVIGKYNEVDTNIASVNGKYAFIVGNGEDDKTRTNAFTVDWRGSAQVGASQLTKDYVFNTRELITKEYADENYGGGLICKTDGNKKDKIITFNKLTKLKAGYYPIIMVNESTAQDKLTLKINNWDAYDIYIDNEITAAPGTDPEEEPGNYKLDAGQYLVYFDEGHVDKTVTPIEEHAGRGFYFRRDAYVENLTNDFVGQGSVSVNRFPTDLTTETLRLITATGDYSTAEGYNTLAQGEASHAEGISVDHIEDKWKKFGSDSESAVTNAEWADEPNKLLKLYYTYTFPGEVSPAGFTFNHLDDATVEPHVINKYVATAASTKSMLYIAGYKGQAPSTLDCKNNWNWLVEPAHDEYKGGAHGMYSHVEGKFTTTQGVAAHAEGTGTKALGNNAHAEGTDTTAHADNSHAEGFNTLATGSGAHAEGKGSDNTAVSMELKTVSAGAGDYIEISKAVQETVLPEVGGIVSYMHQYLAGTYYTGTVEKIERVTTPEVLYKLYVSPKIPGSIYALQDIDNWTYRKGTYALGDYSHTEGVSTQTGGVEASTGDKGVGAHAEGFQTIAGGNYSHAEGAGDSSTYNKALGTGSHVEGYCTEVSKNSTYAHAEGVSTKVSDATLVFNDWVKETKYVYGSVVKVGAATYKCTAAHTSGAAFDGTEKKYWAEYNNTYNNTSTGAHAEGKSTEAKGAFSHAEGLGTIALGEAQHVSGRYNLEDESLTTGSKINAAGNFAEIVGNGYVNPDSTINRSNARTLDWEGNEKVGGYYTTQKSQFKIKDEVTATGTGTYTHEIELDHTVVDYESISAEYGKANYTFTGNPDELDYTKQITKEDVDKDKPVIRILCDDIDKKLNLKQSIYLPVTLLAECDPARNVKDSTTTKWLANEVVLQLSIIDTHEKVTVTTDSPTTPKTYKHKDNYRGKIYIDGVPATNASTNKLLAGRHFCKVVVKDVTPTGQTEPVYDYEYYFSTKGYLISGGGGGFICKTEASEAAKVVDYSDFTLREGSFYSITMVNANENNTADYLTLNIGTTGAKPIYINGIKSRKETKTTEGVITDPGNWELPAGQYEVYYGEILPRANMNVPEFAYFFRTDKFVETLTENFVGEGSFSLNRAKEQDTNITKIGDKSVAVGNNSIAAGVASVAEGTSAAIVKAATVDLDIDTVVVDVTTTNKLIITLKTALDYPFVPKVKLSYTYKPTEESEPVTKTYTATDDSTKTVLKVDNYPEITAPAKTGWKAHCVSYSIVKGGAYGDYSHTEGIFTTTGSTNLWEASHNYLVNDTVFAKDKDIDTVYHAYICKKDHTSSAAKFEDDKTTYWTESKASHAEGIETVAAGQASHAEGQSTAAVGTNSHAEGLSAKAIGAYTHVEGEANTAYGGASHAEGEGDTRNINIVSITEKVLTVNEINEYIRVGSVVTAQYTDTATNKTTDYYFKVEKLDHNNNEITLTVDATKIDLSKLGSWKLLLGAADGDYSHAEGWSNQAIGKASHAEGYRTAATGAYAHAEGEECGVLYYTQSEEYTIPTADIKSFEHRAISGEERIIQIVLESDHIYDIPAGTNLDITYNGTSVVQRTVKVLSSRNMSTDPNRFVMCVESLIPYVDDRSKYTIKYDKTYKLSKTVSAEGEASHTEGYKTIAYDKYDHAEGTSSVTVKAKGWKHLNVKTVAFDMTATPNTVHVTTLDEITQPTGCKIRHTYNFITTEYVTLTSALSTELIIDKATYEGPDPDVDYDAAVGNWDIEIADAEYTANGYAAGEASHVEGAGTKAGMTTQELTDFKSAALGKAIDWAAGIDYIIDDVVRNADELYKCIVEHTSVDPFDASKWQKLEFTGNYAHAQNEGTIASRHAQTAIGRYNVEDTDILLPGGKHAFIVGNGTSNNDRSNAFTVSWRGSAQIGADQTADNYIFNQKELITKEYADATYTGVDAGLICTTSSDIAEKIIYKSDLELKERGFLTINLVKKNTKASLLTLHIREDEEATVDTYEGTIYINDKISCGYSPSSKLDAHYFLEAGKYEVLYEEVSPATVPRSFKFYFRTDDFVEGKDHCVLGGGSISFNRAEGTAIGENSVTVGDKTIATGKSAVAEGTSLDILSPEYKYCEVSKIYKVASSTPAKICVEFIDALDIKQGQKFRHLAYKTGQYKEYVAGTDSTDSKLYILESAYDEENEGAVADTSEGTASEEAKSSWTRIETVGTTISAVGAAGNYSHVEGKYTNAVGEGSHAEGLGPDEITIGKTTRQLDVERAINGTITFTDRVAWFWEAIFSTADNPNIRLDKILPNISKATFKFDNAGVITTRTSDITSVAAETPEAGKITLGISFERTLGTCVEATVQEYETISEYTWSKQATTGNYAHSEGVKTVANGDGSHTEGYQTVALGKYSHAEGISDYISEGDNSLFTTVTRSADQKVFDCKLNPNCVIISLLQVGKYLRNEKVNETDLNSKIFYIKNITLATDNSTYVTLRSLSSAEVPTQPNIDGWGIYAGAAFSDGSHVEGELSIALGKASHAEGKTINYTTRRAVEVTSVLQSAMGVGYTTITLTNDTIDTIGKLQHRGTDGIWRTHDSISGTSGNVYEIEDWVEDVEGPRGSEAARSNWASIYVAKAADIELSGKGAVGDYSHTEGIYTSAIGKASHAEGISVAIDPAERYETLSHIDDVVATTEAGTIKINLTVSLAEYANVPVRQLYDGKYTYYTTDSSSTDTSLVIKNYTGPAVSEPEAKQGWEHNVEYPKNVISGGAISNYSHAEGYLTKAGLTADDIQNGIDELTAWAAEHEYKVGDNIKYKAASEDQYKDYVCIEEHTSTADFDASKWRKVTYNSDYTHTQNLGTVATRKAQTVVGKYNAKDNDKSSEFGKHAFIVGNGANDLTRDNAFTVDWNGSAHIGADQTAADYAFGTKELITKEYADITYTGEASLICDTAGDQANKYIYALTDEFKERQYLNIKLNNSNTAESDLKLFFKDSETATESTYECAIYINGEKSSSTNYTLPAGVYKKVLFKDSNLTGETKSPKIANLYFRTDERIEGLTANYDGVQSFSLNRAEQFITKQTETATGACSVAAGENVVASGTASHAEGKGIETFDKWIVPTYTSVTVYDEPTKTIALNGLFNTPYAGRKLRHLDASGTNPTIRIYTTTSDSSIIQLLVTNYQGDLTAPELSTNWEILTEDEVDVVGALGAYSHTEGYQTTASGEGAHAEGYAKVVRNRQEWVNLSVSSLDRQPGYTNIPLSTAIPKITTNEQARNRPIRHIDSNGKAHIYVSGENSGMYWCSCGAMDSDDTTTTDGWTMYIDPQLVSEHIGGIASGNYSHSEGYNTIASGQGAHSEGEGYRKDVYQKADQLSLSDYINNITKDPDNNKLTLILSSVSAFGGQDPLEITQTSVATEVTTSYNFTVDSINATVTIAYSDYKGPDPATSLEDAKKGWKFKKLSAETDTEYFGAFGKGAHTEGINSAALGNYSHAEGNSTRAGFDASAAPAWIPSIKYTVGEVMSNDGKIYCCIIDNSDRIFNKDHWKQLDLTTTIYAHAEGSNTRALENSSHAEGSASMALGTSAHAEGYTSKALGKGAHAEGKSYIAGSETEADYSWVEQYIRNITPDTYSIVLDIWIVGARSDDEVRGARIKHIYNGKEFYYTASEWSGLYWISTTAPLQAGDAATRDNWYFLFNTATDSQWSGINRGETGALGNFSHTEGVNTLAKGVGSHAEGKSIGIDDEIWAWTLEAISSITVDTTTIGTVTLSFDPELPESITPTNLYLRQKDGDVWHYYVTTAESTRSALIITNYVGPDPRVSPEKAKATWERWARHDAARMTGGALADYSHTEGNASQTGMSINDMITYLAKVDTWAEKKTYYSTTLDNHTVSVVKHKDPTDANAEYKVYKCLKSHTTAEGATFDPTLWQLVTFNADYSHAQNEGTLAFRKAQTTIGKYNAPDEDISSEYGKYALIIGNGESDESRSNALTVDWYGALQANKLTDGITTKTMTEVLAGGAGGFICNTEGNVAAKVINYPGFTLIPGSYYSITMVNANTANAKLTLSIGGSAAIDIYINGKVSRKASIAPEYELGNFNLPAGQYLVKYDVVSYTNPGNIKYGFFFNTDGSDTNIAGTGSLSVNRLPFDNNNRTATKVGLYSTAEGLNTVATGTASHAEGTSAEIIAASYEYYDAANSVQVDSTAETLIIADFTGASPAITFEAGKVYKHLCGLTGEIISHTATANGTNILKFNKSEWDATKEGELGTSLNATRGWIKAETPSSYVIKGGAQGDYSHSEGYQTLAKGESSHAEGKESPYNTEAAYGYTWVPIATTDIADVFWDTDEDVLGIMRASELPKNIERARQTIDGTTKEYISSDETGTDYFRMRYTDYDGPNPETQQEEFKQGWEFGYIDGTIATVTQTGAEGIAAHTEGSMTVARGNYSHAEGIGGGTELTQFDTWVNCSVDEITAGGDVIILAVYATATTPPTKVRQYYNGAFTEYAVLKDSSTASSWYIDRASYVGPDVTTGTARRCWSYTQDTSELVGTIAIGAEGVASHVEGYQTTAYGNYSHAEGAGYIKYIKPAAEVTWTGFNSTTPYPTTATGQKTGFIMITADNPTVNVGDIVKLDIYSGGYLEYTYYYAVSSVNTDYSATETLVLLKDCRQQKYSDYTFTFSWNTITAGTDMITNICTSGEGAHSEGEKTAAQGDYSHTEGHNTLTTGNYAHAEGGSLDYLLDYKIPIAAINSFGTKTQMEIDNTATVAIMSLLKAACKLQYVSADNKISIFTVESVTVNSSTGLTIVSLTENAHIFDTNNWYYCSENIASGDYSHVEGLGANSSGLGTHAEGCITKASGKAAHAEGYYTTATGDYSHAEGTALQKTNATIIIRDVLNVTRASSLTETSVELRVYNSVAATVAGVVLYHRNLSGDVTKFITTDESYHSGNYDYFVVENYDISVEGEPSETYSGSWGRGVRYVDKYATVYGSAGQFAHTEGCATTAYGNYSHAEGSLTKIGERCIYNLVDPTEESAVTYEFGTKYLYNDPIEQKKEIYICKVTHTVTYPNKIDLAKFVKIPFIMGNASHTEGYSTTVTGDYSHAEGYNTKVYSNYSHAEGINTEAGSKAFSILDIEWKAAHAYAVANVVYNKGILYDCLVAHTSGTNFNADLSDGKWQACKRQIDTWINTAQYTVGNIVNYINTLYYCIVDSKGTVPSENPTYWRNISIQGAHAGGEGTIAAKTAQTAIGRYNVEDTTTGRYGDFALIVGKGTDKNNRSNAMTVDWNGIVDACGGFAYRTAPTGDIEGGLKFIYCDEDPLVYEPGYIYFISETPAETNYFYVENLDAGSGNLKVRSDISTTEFTKKFKYKIGEATTWTDITADSTVISIPSGEKCYFKANAFKTGEATWTTDFYFEVGGDLLSLERNGIVPAYAFANMFEDDDQLTGITNLIYSGAKLPDYCLYKTFSYSGISSVPAAMFSSVTEICSYSLAGTFRSTPISSLPSKLFNSIVTYNGDHCFNDTFNSCSSLSTLPADLFASNVTVQNTGGYIFYSTFQSCENLTTCCALPTMSVVPVEGCYNMFRYCTKLNTLPKLNSLSLQQWAYESMFQGCSLIKVLESSSPTAECPNAFRIPTTGSATLSGSYHTSSMFASTASGSVSTPTIGTTYYTNATLVG